MRGLLLLVVCVLPTPFLLAQEETDPEPTSPDRAILNLSKAADDAEKIGKEPVEAHRKRLVAQLKRKHAALVNRNPDTARDIHDRLLLAESLEPGRGLDTKLTVPKLLEKASADGKYRELLHVLYVPNDKQGYTEFREWGHYTGTAYGGYNNLKPGYWVYCAPRWYIWKEITPAKK